MGINFKTTIKIYQSVLKKRNEYFNSCWNVLTGFDAPTLNTLL